MPLASLRKIGNGRLLGSNPSFILCLRVSKVLSQCRYPQTPLKRYSFRGLGLRGFRGAYPYWVPSICNVPTSPGPYFGRIFRQARTIFRVFIGLR